MANENLEQRTNELAIINSIQQGLAAELGFQSIVDLIGDELRQVFNTPDLSIRWFEEKTSLVHNLYLFENGDRLHVAPDTLQPNTIFAKILKTHQPVVWNTASEGDAISSVIPGTSASKSGISVPIVSGDRVLGSIQMESLEHEHAYGEAELRLLTTIATSLGTSLENARLFDETQRLLEETKQRADELTIINNVSQAMSRQMKVDAIIRTVGDQVRDSLHSEIVNIALYDPANNLIKLPYSYDRMYVDTPPFPYGSGLTSQVIDSQQPLLLQTFEEIMGEAQF